MRLGCGFDTDRRFDDATVSSRHALVLTRLDGSVEILDENSLSGTWINGERVDRRTLHHGDVIRIGATVLSFPDLPEHWASHVDAGAQELSC